MKKILFVINTLSRAGAETALIELLNRLSPEKVKDTELHLFVLTSLGELEEELPPYVKLTNKELKKVSVLSGKGRRCLLGLSLKALLLRGQLFIQFPYLAKNFFAMIKNKGFMADKLLWRPIAMGAVAPAEEYDLAVSFLEGGSAYYVAERVKARHKAAFIHVDYEKAGYTRALDKGIYDSFDRIFCVSGEVKESFNRIYPLYADKTEVFQNFLGRSRILKMAELPGGFTDDFEGVRLLTIGRLTKQKAFEVSVEAMDILIKKGIRARWYVLGEGDQRGFLEKLIENKGLGDSFILLGRSENPYPYLKKADIYVHASAFEGKSIAIQEAKVLGKPILVSDCQGNREQIENEVSGLMCLFNPEAIAEGILRLIEEPEKASLYGKNAALSMEVTEEEKGRLSRLLDLLN